METSRRGLGRDRSPEIQLSSRLDLGEGGSSGFLDLDHIGCDYGRDLGLRSDDLIDFEVVQHLWRGGQPLELIAAFDAPIGAAARLTVLPAPRAHAAPITMLGVPKHVVGVPRADPKLIEIRPILLEERKPLA